LYGSLSLDSLGGRFSPTHNAAPWYQHTSFIHTAFPIKAFHSSPITQLHCGAVAHTPTRNTPTAGTGRSHCACSIGICVGQSNRARSATVWSDEVDQKRSAPLNGQVYQNPSRAMVKSSVNHTCTFTGRLLADDPMPLLRSFTTAAAWLRAYQQQVWSCAPCRTAFLSRRPRRSLSSSVHWSSVASPRSVLPLRPPLV